MLRLLRKKCQTTANYTKDPQGEFSDKISPDIDGFTDEPVVQCECWSYKKYFCRWFQINYKMITKYKWFQINFDKKLIWCTVSGTNFVYIVFVFLNIEA